MKRNIKIIVIGNSGVGKSCIIKRFCEKRFVAKCVPTVGIDYGVTKTNVDKTEVRVNIFDMSGNPIFYEIRNEFYQEVHGVLLVYDIGDRSSFEALNTWLAELSHELESPLEFENTVGIVCGNKSDRLREVEKADGKLWADLIGFSSFETSALTGDGINDMFQMMFTHIIEMLEGGKKSSVSKSKLSYTAEQLEAIHRLRWVKDDYEKLGLKSSASREEINRAYRKYAVLLHPDKSTAPGSEDAFKILVTTRLSLLRRTKY